MSTGSWGNLSSLSGLLTHVTRAEYGTFRLGLREGSESFAERVCIYLRHTMAEGLYCGLPLAGVACLVLSCKYTQYAASSGTRTADAVSATAAAAAAAAAAAGTKGGDSIKSAKQKKYTDRGSAAAVPMKSSSSPSVKGSVEGTTTTTTAAAAATTADRGGRGGGGGEWVFSVCLCLFLAWLGYTLVWHGVFSNLPLNSPMPFGVHAR